MYVSWNHAFSLASCFQILEHNASQIHNTGKVYGDSRKKNLYY